MFRTSSRSLWGVASRASSNRASQFLPRASIAPLLRQQRAAYSSKSDEENPPPPKQPIDIEAERKRGQELLQSNPSVVSSKSSVANAASTAQGSKSADQDMTSELKHDIDSNSLKDVVKDTFTFTDVPRESSILGLAGTLPYLGTSLSTVFLAWDLNKPIPTGNSFYDAIMIDHETAKYLLSALEPIQLGYGAVIISFLGAIHWLTTSDQGLEYAEKQPLRERTRFRYGMGLAASIVAWPTLMLPVEYALTSQFMAFVALYFADSRAATKGWAPRWYGSYRFLLTAMVGFAIFISLIGRAKIKQGDAITAKGLSDNFARSGIADHDTNWEKLEAEEKARRRKQKEEEEKKAKEAEKKKKEEEKKGKKKDGKGDDKAKKGDDKNKASEEGNKKDEEKSENKDKDTEKKDDGKDSESKDEGESKDESKDEDKKSQSDEDIKDDKDKKSEESSDKESKDDSKQESDNKDDKKDQSEDKEEKSDEKKDDKSEGKKDKKE
ncbi:hypothetical protein FOXB_12310 [Fusarium oxysporum f. sp. conglutinans Fo5176]|uniref:Halomucin n=1 Tax=Fusarium oxysporum (strain Fo5176) TaxID=660025 RepID=F9G0X8_FUSOF|nr:hypothetical protein FOXB_12310 [Fusarium oxysporum f. sp. conglutinans Fo5176]